MTVYQRITPVGSIYDDGKEGSLCRVAFSIMTVRRSSETFLKELISILVTAGIGTYGTDIFASSGVALPTSGTFITVVSTPGPGPDYTHNQNAPAYLHSMAKIIAYAATYAVAEAKASAAWNALAEVKNQDVTPVP